VSETLQLWQTINDLTANRLLSIEPVAIAQVLPAYQGHHKVIVETETPTYIEPRRQPKD
jgi:hypothetical protein